MTEKQSWFKRLKVGLKKSSDKITQGVSHLLTRKKLDAEALEGLEEILISADIPLKTAQKLLNPLAKAKFGQETTEEEIRKILATEITEILKPHQQDFPLLSGKTNVVLVVGVNGSGKTTTIGKLAKLWHSQGFSVRLVAGDTFRAAAVSQLKIWAERLNIPIMVPEDNKTDAASLVYDAYQRAQANREDILLIDTAGRLHNRVDLMAELEKIIRVLKKIDENAPHQCLMILDATTGQNLFAQVEAFKQYAKVTGLIMTKLDGTARGGILIGLADSFGLPIHAIGVGEAEDDLQFFQAQEFSATLLGIENHD